MDVSRRKLFGLMALSPIAAASAASASPASMEYWSGGYIRGSVIPIAPISGPWRTLEVTGRAWVDGALVRYVDDGPLVYGPAEGTLDDGAGI